MVSDKKGTSLIIWFCSRLAGAAEGIFKAQTFGRPSHPEFGTERPSSVGTGSYYFQLRIV